MSPKDASPWEFVVTTNPNESIPAATRKRVRSAAAQKSWITRTSNTRKRSRQESEEGSEDQAAVVTVMSESFKDATPQVGEELTQEHSKIPLLSTMEESRARLANVRKKRIATSSGSAIVVRLPTASPPRIATDKLDPFNCYPVPSEPWFDEILHHMLTVFAPRGWPALGITKSQGLKWEWFMTQHALAEPALFYVRLLFASGDLIRMNALKPEIAYWLRSRAIRAINTALDSSDRAVSDALILAVGRIALNESMYGDRDAANKIHRPAQQRMIKMRGGMRALDFPELVKRLMRWADRVMSMQGGTERFLPDNDEEESFTISQSVEVLEKWVPKEGQDLRRKIKISDLLS